LVSILEDWPTTSYILKHYDKVDLNNNTQS